MRLLFLHWFILFLHFICLLRVEAYNLLPMLLRRHRRVSLHALWHFLHSAMHGHGVHPVHGHSTHTTHTIHAHHAHPHHRHRVSIDETLGRRVRVEIISHWILVHEHSLRRNNRILARIWRVIKAISLHIVLHFRPMHDFVVSLHLPAPLTRTLNGTHA